MNTYKIYLTNKFTSHEAVEIEAVSEQQAIQKLDRDEFEYPEVLNFEDREIHHIETVDGDKPQTFKITVGTSIPALATVYVSGRNQWEAEQAALELVSIGDFDIEHSLNGCHLTIAGSEVIQ
ncbi:hypothetical protein [Paraburkholderia fungorum]|jgi:hypothetical protein|uniref:hypothetical protein n=1 Tax=Paraburkholderia fungorum TaxID=134537 RepID=UPI000D07FE34|nr:hypothetical protein [Paraburkholderia fungorum]PRZ48171.1 hypothetical protein BX589_128127 [Paraburkholderia fungorum]